MTEGSGGIVEAEVRGYVDRIDGTRRRDVRWKRGNEGRSMRLMGKGLHAGGMEEGVWPHPETGVPQGGVASPVCAQICLHHGLEEWFEGEGRPRMQGRCC